MNENERDDVLLTEQRSFTILHRERVVNKEERARNRSALFAGACTLATAVSVYFQGADPTQVIQHELQALTSWNAFGQYLNDLGPITTLLASAAGGFVAKWFHHSRRFREAQEELNEIHNIIEEHDNELGGNNNARTR